jgi:hypothetical protein
MNSNASPLSPPTISQSRPAHRSQLLHASTTSHSIAPLATPAPEYGRLGNHIVPVIGVLRRPVQKTQAWMHAFTSKSNACRLQACRHLHETTMMITLTPAHSRTRAPTPMQHAHGSTQDVDMCSSRVSNFQPISKKPCEEILQ